MTAPRPRLETGRRTRCRAAAAALGTGILRPQGRRAPPSAAPHKHRSGAVAVGMVLRVARGSGTRRGAAERATHPHACHGVDCANQHQERYDGQAVGAEEAHVNVECGPAAASAAPGGLRAGAPGPCGSRPPGARRRAAGAARARPGARAPRPLPPLCTSALAHWSALSRCCTALPQQRRGRHAAGRQTCTARGGVRSLMRGLLPALSALPRSLRIGHAQELQFEYVYSM